MGAIGVGLLILFQLVTFIADSYHQRQNESLSPPDPRLSGNVFQDMRYTHPKNRRPIPQKIRQPQPISLPVPNYAPVSGNAAAPFVLTIFNDPACGPCRREVNDLLRQAPLDKLQVVHRFKAAQPNALDAALMVQIAHKEGQAHAFLAHLHQRQETLTESDFIAILEDMGISLTTQRYHFSRYLDDMLRNVNADLELARNLGLYRVPSFFINGIPLDSDWTSRNNLKIYMARMENEEDLVQAQDFKRPTKASPLGY